MRERAQRGGRGVPVMGGGRRVAGGSKFEAHRLSFLGAPQVVYWDQRNIAPIVSQTKIQWTSSMDRSHRLELESFAMRYNFGTKEFLSVR